MQPPTATQLGTCICNIPEAIEIINHNTKPICAASLSVITRKNGSVKQTLTQRSLTQWNACIMKTQNKHNSFCFKHAALHEKLGLAKMISHKSCSASAHWQSSRAINLSLMETQTPVNIDIATDVATSAAPLTSSVFLPRLTAFLPALRDALASW